VQGLRVAIGVGLARTNTLDAVIDGPDAGRQKRPFGRDDRLAGRGDRRIFVRPVEPRTRQQPHVTAVEPGMHAVAVELDFAQPLVAFRRRFDQLGELRRDPFRQIRRTSRVARSSSLGLDLLLKRLAPR
jgi:hypothetical protein